jgi:hypothetical protein
MQAATLWPMRLPSRSPRPRVAFVIGLIAGLILAACSGGTGTSPAPSGAGPGASGGAAACQSAPAANLTGWGSPSVVPSFFPEIIAETGELTCGKMRVLFSFLDAANNVLAKPDRSARIAVYDLGRDPAKAIATADATFLWGIQDVRGLYVASIDFPEAGTYGAGFTTAVGGGTPTTFRVTFDVAATTSLIQVGQKAPSVKTPSAADDGGSLSHISTDATPDPAFYETSEDLALAEHKPFLIVFATPKFCQTAQCGPTLDRLKPFATKYPTVAFIHVEPYELKLDNGELQAALDSNNYLVPTAVTNSWGLSSEPWVFVVDKDGIVRGSFGLIFSDAEITAALDTVK